LSIDDRDIPLTYDVQDTEKTIAPPFRGGAFVPFGVRQIRTVTGSIHVHAGQADVIPTFGELTPRPAARPGSRLSDAAVSSISKIFRPASMTRRSTITTAHVASGSRFPAALTPS